MPHIIISTWSIVKTLETWIVKRPLLTNHSDEETLVSWQDSAKVLDIAHCVASGLSYVHGHGTIHSGLKPRDGKFVVFPSKVK